MESKYLVLLLTFAVTFVLAFIAQSTLRDPEARRSSGAFRRELVSPTLVALVSALFMNFLNKQEVSLPPPPDPIETQTVAAIPTTTPSLPSNTPRATMEIPTSSALALTPTQQPITPASSAAPLSPTSTPQVIATAPPSREATLPPATSMPTSPTSTPLSSVTAVLPAPTLPPTPPPLPPPTIPPTPTPAPPAPPTPPPVPPASAPAISPSVSVVANRAPGGCGYVASFSYRGFAPNTNLIIKSRYRETECGTGELIESNWVDGSLARTGSDGSGSAELRLNGFNGTYRYSITDGNADPIIREFSTGS